MPKKHHHIDYKKVIPDISLTISLIIVVIFAEIVISIFGLTPDSNFSVFIHLVICFVAIKILYNIITKLLIKDYEKKMGIH